MYSSRVLAKWKQLMGHNFPAPTAEILSGPGAEREGMSECLQYGFYWYVILATWWKHHSFFGNLNEGKNVSEKCTLIHSLIYLCIVLIYLSSSQRYHILFLISRTTFIRRRTKLCWTKIYTDKFIILNLSPSIRNICLTRGILYKNLRTHCEPVSRWLAPFRDIKRSLTQTLWHLTVTRHRHIVTTSGDGDILGASHKIQASYWSMILIIVTDWPVRQILWAQFESEYLSRFSWNVSYWSVFRFIGFLLVTSLIQCRSVNQTFRQVQSRLFLANFPPFIETLIDLNFNTLESWTQSHSYWSDTI